MILYTKYCLIWDCTIYTILSDLGLYSMHHTDLNCTVYTILSNLGLYTAHHTVIKLYSMHHTILFGLYHMYHTLWFGIVQHASCWFGIVQYAPYCLIWVCMVCIILFDLGLYAMHHTVWFGIVQYPPHCLIWDDKGSKLWVWKLKGYIRTCEANPLGIFITFIQRLFLPFINGQQTAERQQNKLKILLTDNKGENEADKSCCRQTDVVDTNTHDLRPQGKQAQCDSTKHWNNSSHHRLTSTSTSTTVPFSQTNTAPVVGLF